MANNWWKLSMVIHDNQGYCMYVSLNGAIVRLRSVLFVGLLFDLDIYLISMDTLLMFSSPSSAVVINVISQSFFIV